MRLSFLFLLSLSAVLLAVEPRLRLSANQTTAEVGDLITVTVEVVDALPFSCWGATVLMPGPAIGTTAQEAGATPTFVPDSRSLISTGARFGGYHGFDPATNHPAGTYVLVRVTVRASQPGTYVLRAPGYDAQSAPFGGLLLPTSDSPYPPTVLTGTELTLTITGTAVPRTIAMQVDPGFVWTALAPADAEVTLPAGGLQLIKVEAFQDALLAPVPAVNQ